MRVVLCIAFLGTAFIPTSALQTASAQTTKTAPAPPASAPCTCVPPRPQSHLPAYTAKRESTTVQKLPDGTTVTRVTEALLYRDADGRTRTETTRLQPNGAAMTFISVLDPVEGIDLSWNINAPGSGAKVVNVRHYLRQRPQLVAPIPQPARRYFPYSSQSLPPQTIAGFYAEGTRTTRTTPAGYEGNDHDITSTQENWNSPELGLQLRTINDDPRSGRSTSEISNIQLTTPDPALFKAPEGYTINEPN